MTKRESTKGPLEGALRASIPAPSLAYFYSAALAWNHSGVDSFKKRQLVREARGGCPNKRKWPHGIRAGSHELVMEGGSPKAR